MIDVKTNKLGKVKVVVGNKRPGRPPPRVVITVQTVRNNVRFVSVGCFRMRVCVCVCVCASVACFLRVVVVVASFFVFVVVCWCKSVRDV